MADIIDQLIEIDNRAHEILGDIEEEKRTVSDLSNLLARQLKDKIEILAEMELKQFSGKNSAMINERSKQIKASADYFVVGMQKEFDANKEKWCHDILNDIINGF